MESLLDIKSILIIIIPVVLTFCMFSLGMDFIRNIFINGFFLDIIEDKKNYKNKKEDNQKIKKVNVNKDINIVQNEINTGKEENPIRYL